MLTSLVVVPLVGAVLALLLRRGGDRVVRQLALGVSLVAFGVSLLLWARFDASSAAYQFVERYPWLPEFGVSYHVGMDGISLLLVVLTTFLTPIALLCSWESVEDRVAEFSFFMLTLEAAMIGVFISLDLFLFYVFWDAMLIPMYFLIGIWGYDRRIYASMKFLLYTMAGSVLMLLAIIWLAYYHRAVHGVPSFDLADLIALDVPGGPQTWLFLAFAVAFAIKVPLFPVSHLAARCARAGADSRFRHSGRRAPEDGDLRPAAIRLPALSAGRDSVRALDCRAGGHRRRLRRPRGHGAAGHEEARGLLVGQPLGHRRAGPDRAHRATACRGRSTRCWRTAFRPAGSSSSSACSPSAVTRGRSPSSAD